MTGNAFLIAGFDLNQTAADEKYRHLRDMVKTKGYKVIAVNITWKHHTMSRYVHEFTELYHHMAGSHNIIIGNSFGAMVAMITAPTLSPDKIILCSLSPFFQEDIPRFRPGKLQKWFGQRRVADFKTISAKAAAKAINKTNIKSVFFYGEQEKRIHKKLVERVIDSASDLKGSKPIEIPNAPHSFRDPIYINAISKVL